MNKHLVLDVIIEFFNHFYFFGELKSFLSEIKVQTDVQSHLEVERQ